MAINVDSVGNEGGFQPNFKPDCDDKSEGGTPSARYDYIQKSILDGTYPDEACTPYYHSAAQIDDIQVNSSMTGNGEINIQGNITSAGTVTAPTFQGQINVQTWKGFDIKHPNKKGQRLRHICLEGPEAGVYIRGRLTGSNVINLPGYWKGLVDLESITVSLTQIGSSQDLIVEGVEDWGTKVKVRSGNASAIDCYYTVQASRIDGEPLIIEYEGETPADYPGNSAQFSISGFDY